jgi:1,4-alpha-glucan branching enzyme
LYGGSNTGNAGGLAAEPLPADGHPFSLDLFVPPLGCLFLKK